MKRTNLIFGRRGFVLALAGTAAMLGTAGIAQADLTDPHVFLDYNGLDFTFARTGANVVGGVIGDFEISDGFLSDMNAFIRNASGTPVDMARISDPSLFDLSLSGSVVYHGANSYSLVGSFIGTDATGNGTFSASFGSISVQLFPISFAKTFEVTGSLGSPAGGGPILTGGTSTDWSFVGEAGKAPDALDIGGDDTIGISGAAGFVDSYDTGALIALHFNVDHGTLDSLFSDDTAFGQGEMNVTIIPAPTALVLGLIGFGTVGWFRRRMG